MGLKAFTVKPSSHDFTRHVHIIGAGMAGLSAALQLTLAGENVALYEAAPFAGGRCRSFFDRELDCRIDNGNHLVLSGNVAIYDYLSLTNALETMGGSGQADISLSWIWKPASAGWRA